mmetsp:Transcript_7065/g.21111  ORF Transcript_7065/g.21111 Transcript_7065/m.21111 type:complete len:108 (-) Transcript_7065:792-1115(-)
MFVPTLLLNMHNECLMHSDNNKSTASTSHISEDTKFPHAKVNSGTSTTVLLSRNAKARSATDPNMKRISPTSTRIATMFLFNERLQLQHAVHVSAPRPLRDSTPLIK